MFKSVLVAHDGSDNGAKALTAAIDMASKYGAPLAVVHVHLHGRPVEELARMAAAERIISRTASQASLGPSGGTAASMQELMKSYPDVAELVTRFGDFILEGSREEAVAQGVTQVQTYSRGGDYADGILDVAEEIKPDVIVLGSRGLGRLRQVIVGSVANKVVQHAKCAVMIIK